MIHEETIQKLLDALAVKRQIKDFAVKRFPGHGHVVHGFRPEPFLETLEPFLRRLRSPAG